MGQLQVAYKLMELPTQLVWALCVAVFISDWLVGSQFTGRYTQFIVYAGFTYAIAVALWKVVQAALNSSDSPRAAEFKANREKDTEEGEIALENFTIKYAASSMQGWRDSMEDAHVIYKHPTEDSAMIAVLDGHGGSIVAQLTKKFLPEQVFDCLNYFESQVEENKDETAEDAISKAFYKAFTDVDDKLRTIGNNAGKQDLEDAPSPMKNFVRFPIMGARQDMNCFQYVGCTCVCLVVQGNRISIANVGDSRAFLCRNGEFISLSHEHKPESPREADRIKKAGATVAQNGPCWRINGYGLNLSRAFGDFGYKMLRDRKPEEQQISVVPDVIIDDLRGGEEFLLLACDGIFELLSPHDVYKVVKERMRTKTPLREICENLLDIACSKNPRLTQGKGTDNETIILMTLNPPAGAASGSNAKKTSS